MNHFIDIQKRNQQTFQNVQTIQYFLQTVLQTFAHGFGAERQPLHQQAAQIFDLRAAIGANHVEVHTIGFFQIGGSKQMQHQLIGINAVGTRYDHNAGGVFVIGLVAQIHHHRQLFLLHLRGNLLQHFSTRNLIGQTSDHHITIFNFVDRAGAH